MKQTEIATFAGGCFWCMVKPFDQLPGIQAVVSGYSGGHVIDPSYEDVKRGDSGHYEVVQITFDPALFPYKQLLDLYWPQIDPTDDGGQFQDRGESYRTAIFYHNEQQRQMAEESKREVEQSGRFKKPIVTKILPSAPFYPAEDYHQDFYKKNPKEYKEDRAQSGRDEFIESNWK
ncbi:peptide-methionine (S)-S-oxide reductase MsrA [Rossellomorea vietnamensis]|uniref:Peptide methionine sulfoxide reductase MsrA n=2 Tax=Rossellomorea TaxID=2837508 RepID=A0A5D4KAJ6_9BACI|nr:MULTISPECIES: peptide-methionine (S)-S-oxide reductase MsrA [Rossellomorea]TYR74036.1 peptide-methionine (S)-S-oxide reductase MsrA [Rossellomorea vietnamensis]TYS82807.1 peptide-methionine (S)-S-oxide reductase MsrA [Rossellomorea aquimaris]